MSDAARLAAHRSRALPMRALLWLLAAAAAADLLLRVLAPSAGALSFGFASYYTAARLVAAGELGPQIYDNAWFQEQERRLGLRDDIYGHQPPTMALLMLPVAWLPPGPARVAWLTLDVACLALLVLLVLRLAGEGALTRQRPLRASPGLAALLVLVVALYPALRAELRYAQVHTVMALWYALWLFGLVTGRHWLTGAALALLALAKLAGAPLWLLLLALGSWSALAWAAGLTLAGLALTLPLVGADTWAAYLLGRVGDLAANPVFGVTALQTLTSLLRQLFVYDATYTPAPLLHAPLVATTLWISAVGVLVGLTLLVARRAGPLAAGAAALCIVVPIQPAGEQHHYVMLLTPLLLAILLGARQALAWWQPGGLTSATHLGRPVAITVALLVAGASALMLAPTYFLDNAAWAGWPVALLAYPRLYGALLLWAAWLLIATRRPGAQPSAETL